MGSPLGSIKGRDFGEVCDSQLLKMELVSLFVCDFVVHPYFIR